MNAVYYRVSRDDLNLENQRSAMKQLLLKKSATEFVDTESGSHDDREGWMRLKAAIEAGTVKAVYSYHVDRLGRSTLELCRFLDLCEKHGAVIKTPGMSIDPTDEMARGFFQMAAIFAEIELRRIKRRTRDGLARARDEGITLGRPPVLTREQAAMAAEMFSNSIRTDTVSTTFVYPVKTKDGSPHPKAGQSIPRQSIYSALRHWGFIKKSVKELRTKGAANADPDQKPAV